MGDLFSKSRELIVKRHEHTKMVAAANIQAREIRLLELEEETQRIREDMAAQRKVIEEAEKNIQDQMRESEKDKEAKDKAEHQLEKAKET